MNRTFNSARCAVVATTGRWLVLVAAALASAGQVHAATISVGPKEVVYSNQQLKSRGLGAWPNGSLGVVANGGAYDFYAANGSQIVKTTGSLINPASSKSTVTISNLPKKAFDSITGGPVYYDANSGARLMLYHAEKHGKNPWNNRSALGLAVSTDANGLNFRDLGTIIEPNRGTAAITGGSFAVLDDHLHVYYRDPLANGTTNEVAVARASLTDVISGALNGLSTSFSKYYGGSWSQPGLGGLSSPLEIGNPSSSWLGVSYNDYLNQLVMVTSQRETGEGDLFLSTSSDGINWSARQAVAADIGEQFYPSLIGTGPDPTRTGQSFYVYYTDSRRGGDNRWMDATLARRTITLDALSNPGNSGGGGGGAGGDANGGGGNGGTGGNGNVALPTGSAAEATAWIPVADYQSDFHPGGPAAGWKYAWNPTGKRGDSRAFTPLIWSDVAQGYNTTGAATRLPGKKKTHSDDNLVLTAAGGHPGQPSYVPIVGYTIQNEDGAGEYRLAETSIAKSDGILSKKEDGLGVLVYLNNTLLGPSQLVSTNGLAASFNRNLGELNVGDTIWVMVDALKNQKFDAFKNFDFSIQRLTAVSSSTDSTDEPSTVVTVFPEPSTGTLLLLALAGCPWVGRRRSR